MRRGTRLALTLVSAAILCGAVASWSSASLFQFLSTQSGFRIVWSPFLFEAGIAGNITCRITLEGSFHSTTFQKLGRTLVGYITRATIEHPCTGGEFHFLTAAEGGTESLPWHVQYRAFTGALPAITSLSLRVIGMSWRITAGGQTCLSKSTEAVPFEGTVAVGAEAGGLRQLESFRVTETPIVFTEALGGECPFLREVKPIASGPVTVQGGTAKPTIRLVH